MGRIVWSEYISLDGVVGEWSIPYFSDDFVEGDFAVRMNTLPQYVAPNTLRKVDWNTTRAFDSGVVALE